jgi:uncharacterized protein YukE
MTDDEMRYEVREVAALARELSSRLMRLADNWRRLIDEGSGEWWCAQGPAMEALLDAILEAAE